MVTFSMLLFWIPVCIGISSFFYFTKRSRKTVILMLSFLPTAIFYHKNSEIYILSIAFSIIFLRSWVVFITYSFHHCFAISL